MNIPRIRLTEKVKVIFVWDGTETSVKMADNFLSQFKNVCVTCLYALPHESICAYGTVGRSTEHKTLQERDLQKQYEAATRASKMLRNVKLQLVFGERIDVISRLATVIGADWVIFPAFNQTKFSFWIHGDLSQRMIKKSPCDVVFYDTNTLGYFAFESDSTPHAKTTWTNYQNE